MEDSFNSDHYQDLLTHLTTSSRDLILELTTIAQHNIPHSATIAELIEQRIQKCLPRYKLHAFYLMDSIVKNIGNPYNLLFSNNLYKLFTETYLLVTDTLTRQYLIDLFKTWLKGLSSSGLEIFNPELLNKIEQFIIKATSLNSPLANGINPYNANEANDSGGPVVPGEKGFSTRHPPSVNFPIPNNINPEHFHRECNYLLQYIIQINKDLEPYEGSKFYKNTNRIRNELINKINEIDEGILRDSRTDFRIKVQYYHETLKVVRSTLDEQHFKQNIYLQRQFKPKLKPDVRYINYLRNPLESVEDIDNLYFFLENFGLKIRNEELPYLPSVETKEVTPPKEGLPAKPPQVPQHSFEPSPIPSSNQDPVSLDISEQPSDIPTQKEPVVNPLGFGFSFDFDEPDPEPSPPSGIAGLPPRPTLTPETSASKPSSIIQDKKRKLSENKPIKKVRFDV